jgi:flavin reductase (DIM6/NTAB) family NADH-FMN oxidoreductase RutF
MAAVNPTDFRNALGRFATGITIVTALHQGEVRGITVNAFMSVSLEPPMVLVSVDRKAKAHAVLAASDRYGISVLGEEQAHFSNHFAGREAHVANIPYTYLDGFPLIEGAVTHLLCRLADTHDVGDHTLFIGRVERLTWREGRPLLFYTGAYGQLHEPETDPLQGDRLI